MFSTWGALTGLAIAIVLIVRKATPAYALVLGALLPTPSESGFGGFWSTY